MTTESLLSEFEELGIGSSVLLPGTPQTPGSETGPPLDGARALTVLPLEQPIGVLKELV